MLLPDEIAVIGDDAEAETLRRVLLLYVEDCCRLTPASIRDAAQGDGQFQRIRRELDNSPLAIMTAGVTDSAAQIVYLIHRLRTYFGWVGAFVAVVNSEEAARELESSSMVGDKGNNYQFRNVEGHATLSRPLIMSELFAVVESLGEMHRHSWLGFLDQTSVPLLRACVAEAKSLWPGGKDDALIAAVARMLELIRQLDWLCLLDERHAHWGVSLVSSLLEEYPTSKTLERRDCEPIIESVGQLIARSCIGVVA